MMVVPPPRAIILSGDSPPDADRGEKTAANPVPVIKIRRPTRHRLAYFTRCDIFFSSVHCANSLTNPINTPLGAGFLVWAALLGTGPPRLEAILQTKRLSRCPRCA